MDKHIYNFSFSGGRTKEFYLDDYESSGKLSYVKEQIEKVQDEIQNNELPSTNPIPDDDGDTKTGDVPGIIPDGSDGQSEIIPDDETTQTYPPNTVTDDTDPEQDEEKKEDSRKAQNPSTVVNNNDDDDDHSGWGVLDFLGSIWDFIKSLVATIASIFEFLGNLIAKLVQMLLDLFIPSGDFLKDLFSDLGDWFTLKLGFLSYPFELIADVLNKILHIEFTEPILRIPEIKEPLTDNILVHARTFNLNDLLENDTFKKAHDIYFIVVDGIIFFGLVNLLRQKWEEVMTK